MRTARVGHARDCAFADDMSRRLALPANAPTNAVRRLTIVEFWPAGFVLRICMAIFLTAV
jgi:hypothetical protein